jgi:hypothetical protein
MGFRWSLEKRELRDTFSHRRGIPMTIRTPLKAIRAKCLDCSCYQPKEVRECHITTCALWPYRFGKRPATVERAKQVKELVKV